jgi:glutamine cyclotransferase
MIMKRNAVFLLIIVCALALALPAAAQRTTPTPRPAGPEATAEATAAPEAPFVVLLPQVVNQLAHSTTDFTQGLVWSDGRLFQSTGRFGQSRLQELDYATGEVLREVPVGDEFFAEGLALVDDRLIQLTWQTGVAFVWDAETFEQVGEFAYDTEGWGLCYDGEVLWMSDGSANLFKRDAETFELLDTIPVTIDGEPVPEINELECVDGSVWANVWQTPVIVRIDPETGTIDAVADMRPLITQEIADNWANGAVLNGIAWIPERETFLITGKNWPVMYEVTFAQAQAGS